MKRNDRNSTTTSIVIDCFHIHTDTHSDTSSYADSDSCRDSNDNKYNT